MALRLYDPEKDGQTPDQPSTPVSTETPKGLRPYDPAKDAGSSRDIQSREKTLPDPSPNMFADMDDADAADIYNNYLMSQFSSTDNEGNLSYNGKPVPKPEGNTGFVRGATELFGGNLTGKFLGTETPESEAATRLSRGFGGGIINAAKEGVGFLASRADQTIQNAKDLFTGSDIGTHTEAPLTEAVENTLPEFNPEGTAQHIGAAGGQLAAGLALGGAAGKAAKLEKGAELLTKAAASHGLIAKAGAAIANSVIRNAPMAIGVTATQSGKSGTLAVGKDQAMIPILKGLDTTSGNKAQDELNGRINVLLDGVITGMGADAVFGGVKKVISYATGQYGKPIAEAISENSREKKIFNDLLDEVGRLTNDTTPEGRQKITDRIKDIVSKNKEYFGDVGIQNVNNPELGVDTATAFSRGMDPNDPVDVAINQALTARRKEIMQKGGEATTLAFDRPGQALEDLTSQTETALSPQGAADEAMTSLHNVGEAKIGQAEQTATTAGQAAEESKGLFNKTLEESPELGSKIKTETTAPISERGKTLGRESEELLGQINTGEKATHQKSSEAYQEIRNSKIGLPQKQKWQNALVKANIGEEATEPSLIPKNIQEKIADAGNNLALLKADVIPDLQAFRSAQIKTNGYKTDAASQAEGLVKTIEDQINALPAEEVQPFDDAVNKWLNFKETQQGVHRELGEAAAANPVFEARRGEDVVMTDVDRAKEQTDTLLKSMKSKNPADAKRMQHLVDTLERPEYGSDSGKVLDVTKSMIVEDLVQPFREGKVTPELFDNIVDKYRTVLQVRQHGDAAKVLDDLSAKLKTNKDTIKSLDDFYKVAQDTVQTTKDDIYNGVLKDFYHKVGAKVERNTNAVDSFKKLLEDPESLSKVKKIKDLSQNDPKVIDALRGMYARVTNSMIFPGEMTATLAAKPTATGTTKFLKDQNFQAVGKELFGDTYPQFMEVMNDLSNIVNTNLRGMPQRAAKAPASFSENASKQVRKIVGFMYGPLTHRGLQINIAFRALMDFMTPETAGRIIMDAAWADPDRFIHGLDKLKSPTAKSGTSVRDAFNFWKNMNILGDSDKKKFDEEHKRLNKEQDLNNQTDEMLK